ncbi:Membrane-bound lytic murein transglycosylase B precursor [Hartmannibacter diazotrophicus]|uniref:Membrane-bound lytic murein transglycosylase B n=1 Tax=Hartmannibacter diazotrophicus TaxID=1482074 RepID=A0A2C9DDC7_9HYPH|nr:lytic murein transglycosylase [Hartmannibacter diazotrophicus]SON57625.1 Membrane-bound lytic murein transglycosylase B precursor [Hartmannibacter diazotrophicus]
MKRASAITRIGLAILISLPSTACMAVDNPLGLVPSLSAPVQPALNDGRIPADFSAFVERLWPEARDRGISRRVFDQAFANVGPDPDVIEKAHRQPEFHKPIWEYLDGAVSETRIENGKAMLAEHRRLLDRIETTYGVPRQYVVAVWGMESSYGSVLDNPRIVKDVVRSLATLAYDGGKRARFGRQQLLAALAIVQRGDVDARHMLGSWAGAMGHTQFIPTTYEAYAVDFDGDGRRNIWTSVPDALASTANYLARMGWRSGETWGYEVMLPSGFNYGNIGRTMTVADWQSLGIRRANAGSFPRPTDSAQLIMPGGSGGPTFLMLKNFKVIRRYNNAVAYALGVGHLGDRLIGGGPFIASWPRDDRSLSADERMELQALLNAKGFDVGPTDGKIGSGTIEGIRAYQTAMGLVPDGYANDKLLEHLRR